MDGGTQERETRQDLPSGSLMLARAAAAAAAAPAGRAPARPAPPAAAAAEHARSAAARPAHRPGQPRPQLGIAPPTALAASGLRPLALEGSTWVQSRMRALPGLKCKKALTRCDHLILNSQPSEPQGWLLFTLTSA
ncbi:uncharacterized protein LOC144367385 [Ictidomys tridecemlineatus]